MAPTRLTLLCNGTRGDVQPYLALGQRLTQTGYAVTLAAPEAYHEEAAAAGLGFAPLLGNPSAVMMQPEHQGALTLERGWRHAVPATWRFWRAARADFRRMLESAVSACQGATGVLLGLSTTWGVHVAEALGAVSLFTPLQPLTRSRQRPSALLPLTRQVGAAGNALTHWLVEQSLWWPWRAELNRWRVRTLGLKPLWGAPFDHLYARRTPFLYGFSARVAPPAADWPAWHTVTGYWPWEPAAWTAPAALEAFLRAGPPPVYVGFGSMDTHRPEATLELIARAAEQAGVRVIAPATTEAARTVALPANVFALPAAPHHWLFPRLRAAIHHGGAGTTASSLRAGLPTWVVPFAADQFFWGARAHALGVGPAPLARHMLTVTRLAEGLRQLTGDGQWQAAAHTLGEQLRQEDGLGVAAAQIAAYVAR